MIEKFKNLSWKQFGGLVLIIIIIIAFGFGGFGGGFTVEEDNDTYIWIRRFENEQERISLYKKVYESDEWLNGMDKIVETLIDRSATVVKRLKSTDLSVMK